MTVRLGEESRKVPDFWLQGLKWMLVPLIKVGVLVCSGCDAKYHRLGGLNNNLFSHSSEG